MNAKIAIGAALAGAAVLGAIAVAYVSAQPDAGGAGEFDKAEEEAIRAIVHDYILANPDVLVDSLNAYAEKRQADAETAMRETAKANIPALLNGEHGFAAGADPAAATVAVVELFDYHCGFCKRASGFVLDLTKGDPKVKVVFREFPILREESEYAARVALAARKQGKYKELHFALMNANGVLTKERVKEIAQKEGVDFAAVETELANPEIDSAIEETRRIADEMQVDGTPTFIVATLDASFVEVVPGFGAEDVTKAIAEAKKAAKK